MAEIAFEQVTKVYDDGTLAVDELDLAIGDGELMVVVGPSGCGKTTALRMLAGLEEISDGTIRIGDRVINDLTPKERDVAMVFQNYALYPHMTVEGNLAFGLRFRKLPKQEIKKRVHRAAELLEIDGFLDKKPRALSGGQRQRVAMGRAIVREPQAFLMDEPLSNLDAKLRVQMRAEIHDLQRRLGVTTLYVTHDQVEAMTLGDRVAVMLDGRLQQVAVPQALYERPVNEFVAAFIGSPSINMVEAQLARQNGDLSVTFGEHSLAVDPSVIQARPGLERFVGRAVLLGIRPEDFEDAALEPDAPANRRIRTTCELTEPLGAEVLVHFSVSAPAVITRAAIEDEAALQTPVSGGRDGAARFVARVDPRSRI
ncbi:MAG TPA: sn-glycerol-3-phosphate ABC transporter ATP-binding protein UgpC, partial [Gaiellaceae bacterium]|nr:sn-glycerol-3-phosphate ABC transporter ATP-binding protein UgpC [Gaiellaceae bacterium]